MNLEAGALVGNKIRLIRALKRGGMGSVWVAEHQTLRMQVAVKFMAEQLAQDPEYVERFSREAMASAQIKSPHVVQVFDHGVADTTPYIVMELLEGEDLRTRIARAGPIPIGEAATIIVQLARAMAKAHAAGIVHRDIKPDNIFMVEHDGEPFIKVLDFGVAKHVSQESEMAVTGTGAMVGTPHYMSPEQILSARRVDHRADLWSIGVVMYRALTGAVPFSGETLGAVCVAIERGVFIAPSQRRPELLSTLDAWFVRALARDPAARFQTAKEMAEAFVAAVEAGGYAMNAFYRPEISSHGGGSVPPPRRSLAGFSAPPPAPAPSNPWGTNPTNPSMSLSGAPPTQVTVQQRSPLPSSSFSPPMADPAWHASSAAQAPAQPQTFPGASITHAESKGPSRRLLITAVSALCGVLVIVTVMLVFLVGSNEAPSSSAAEPQPVASSSSEPVATQPSPGTTASVATAAATIDPAMPAKNAPVVKTNPTVKPRRDRGF